MRRQRPRGTTTRDAVVAAALDIVDRVGIDALTIRAVAALVNAPPMSLYTHFANKEQLLDLMYAEIAHRLYADNGNATWQAELKALARHVRETLLAHPGWPPLLSRPSVPIVVAVRERVLKLMTDSGMSAGEALQAFSSAMIMSIGMAMVELTFRDTDGASSFGKRYERIRTWFEKDGKSAAEVTTRQAFHDAPRFELGATFEFSLERLVHGLEMAATKREPS